MGSRLIPAHAGKTRSFKLSQNRTRAHPRSRGENRWARLRCGGSRGSSPLTRGKPPRIGTTLGHPRAHPRSRGENRSSGSPTTARRGSSPLTRGKLFGDCYVNTPSGLIPAHAGKTRSPMARRLPGRAHPRSRGENATPAGWRARTSGSSPLTRGKLGFHVRR